MAAADITRCSWCEGDTQYERYHDEEWGVPVYDANALFERLVLESMQAGLSWLTVLRKRAHMQAEFYDFDMSRLAAAGEQEVEHWLQDPGVIRHRGKLEAMLNNARIALQTPGFAAWLWQFAPKSQSTYGALSQVPSVTDDSKAMSRALKRAGFRFVGPTTCYAFMQSVGMVNDHVQDCWRHPRCATLRARRAHA